MPDPGDNVPSNSEASRPMRSFVTSLLEQMLTIGAFGLSVGLLVVQFLSVYYNYIPYPVLDQVRIFDGFLQEQESILRYIFTPQNGHFAPLTLTIEYVDKFMFNRMNLLEVLLHQLLLFASGLLIFSSLRSVGNRHAATASMAFLLIMLCPIRADDLYWGLKVHDILVVFGAVGMACWASRAVAAPTPIKTRAALAPALGYGAIATGGFGGGSIAVIAAVALMPLRPGFWRPWIAASAVGIGYMILALAANATTSGRAPLAFSQFGQAIHAWLLMLGMWPAKMLGIGSQEIWGAVLFVILVGLILQAITTVHCRRWEHLGASILALQIAGAGTAVLLAIAIVRSRDLQPAELATSYRFMVWSGMIVAGVLVALVSSLPRGQVLAGRAILLLIVVAALPGYVKGMTRANYVLQAHFNPLVAGVVNGVSNRHTEQILFRSAVSVERVFDWIENRGTKIEGHPGWGLRGQPLAAIAAPSSSSCRVRRYTIREAAGLPRTLFIQVWFEVDEFHDAPKYVLGVDKSGIIALVGSPRAYTTPRIAANWMIPSAFYGIALRLLDNLRGYSTRDDWSVLGSAEKLEGLELVAVYSGDQQRSCAIGRIEKS